MTDARSEILERIRSARGASAHSPKPYSSIERRYRQATTIEHRQILGLFEDRLHDYGAKVWRCSVADLPQTIADAAASRNETNLLISSGFPREWVPECVRVTVDSGLSYEDVDRIGGVLTTCAFAIAETGTIVLRHNLQEGRRALSLIPDYLLCVVDTRQVVASVVEGIRCCAAFEASPITTISGPSATSDIEMTRIKGVHGPRTLEVILTDFSEAEAPK